MTDFQAEQLFEPYLPWFRECWWTGWNDYNERYSHPWDDGRARSTIIQNRAIIHARSTLSKFPGVEFLEHSTSRRLFRFEDWAIVQFKKLSEWHEKLRLSNNVNPTVEAFDAQQPVLNLGDAPRITVGYLPNEFHTDMTIHMLFTKSHYANNWVINISSAPVIMTMELFSEPEEQATGPVKRVRAKKLILPDHFDESTQG